MNKNSKTVPQTKVLSKLKEAENLNVLHIDRVDMQRSITSSKANVCPSKLANNRKVLQAAAILKNLTTEAEADSYNKGNTYGHFDVDMTDTEKTFAAMDALIENNPEEDDEIITAQEVIEGASGKAHKNTIPTDGAGAEEIMENVLNELANAKPEDLTPGIISYETAKTPTLNNEDKEKEGGLKTFWDKYKLYILGAAVIIVIAILIAKED